MLQETIQYLSTDKGYATVCMYINCAYVVFFIAAASYYQYHRDTKTAKDTLSGILVSPLISVFTIPVTLIAFTALVVLGISYCFLQLFVKIVPQKKQPPL